MLTLLLIILIIFALGGSGVGFNSGYAGVGYGGGIVGLILVVVLLYLLLGHGI